MQLKTFFRNAPTEVDLVEAPEASYATWRQASEGVAEAYRSWAAAPRGERWLAHAAYLAAVDHEEQAAAAYQRRAERLRDDVRGRVS